MREQPPAERCDDCGATLRGRLDDAGCVSHYTCCQSRFGCVDVDLLWTVWLSGCGCGCASRCLAAGGIASKCQQWTVTQSIATSTRARKGAAQPSRALRLGRERTARSCVVACRDSAAQGGRGRAADGRQWAHAGQDGGRRARQHVLHCTALHSTMCSLDSRQQWHRTVAVTMGRVCGTRRQWRDGRTDGWTDGWVRGEGGCSARRPTRHRPRGDSGREK